MAFYSLSFAIFLALLWGASRWAPVVPRQWLFLAASYFFYWSWSRWFVALLIGVSLFDYLWGRLLKSRRRESWLWLGILVNLSVLVACKFLFQGGASPWTAETSTLAPVGVSFFSFQGISYLVDVQRGFEGASSPRPFLLYMAFWPTILAGPICRAPEMLPQFASREPVPSKHTWHGLQRVVGGLFLKLVLAETLWQGVVPGQGLSQALRMAPANLTSPDVFLLVFGLGLWLYLDFSGYSHIVCGAAEMLGIRLRENFHFPYHSLTPQEFWTRWHMSLSSWIRDYIFFPLSTLRRTRAWSYLALFLSLVAFGAWHGPSLNFLLWGAYQGVLLVLWRWLGPDRRSLRVQRGSSHVKLLISGFCSTLLVSLGWLIFFAPPERAAAWFARLVRFSKQPGLGSELFLFTGVLWGAYLALGWLWEIDPDSRKGAWRVWAERYLPGPVCVIMFLLILALSGNESPFAYVSF